MSAPKLDLRESLACSTCSSASSATRFAEGFVDPKLYVAGNAAATAGNVIANTGLVRLAVVSHLLDGTFFMFLALVLYVLLENAHPSVARAMLVLVALATGIICLNAVFQFEALRVASDSSYVTAFGLAGSNALVLLLLDIQHYGTLSAQVFFGLWLAPLGYLGWKSGMFPRWLSVVLVGGTGCYLVDLLAAFLVSRRCGLKIPRAHRHRPRNRRDLDGPLSARGGREDRHATAGHPRGGMNHSCRAQGSRSMATCHGDGDRSQHLQPSAHGLSLLEPVEDLCEGRCRARGQLREVGWSRKEPLGQPVDATDRASAFRHVHGYLIRHGDDEPAAHARNLSKGVSPCRVSRS